MKLNEVIAREALAEDCWDSIFPTESIKRIVEPKSESRENVEEEDEEIDKLYEEREIELEDYGY